MSVSLYLPDEAATVAAGQALAKSFGGEGGVIFLLGDLGAGKTTLVRAVLHTLGYKGRVVSPSYTLMEPYNAGPSRIFHMDLYRLSDPEELEYLGIRDINVEQCLLFVEWPENGENMLPSADLVLELRDRASGRELSATAITARGKIWQQALLNHESVG